MSELDLSVARPVCCVERHIKSERRGLTASSRAPGVRRQNLSHVLFADVVAVMLSAIATAIIAQQQPDAATATAAQRRAVELQPKSAEAYKDLAKAYGRAGFMRSAAETLAVAVKLTPTAKDHLDLAYLLKQIGDIEGARRQIAASNKLSPSASAYVQLSHLATTPAEKLKAVHKAINVDPKSTEAYVRLAKIHTEQGNHAEAEATYQQFSDVAPMKYYHHLRGQARKLEASVALHKAMLRSSGPRDNYGDGQVDEWSAYVDGITENALDYKRKCLARRCIQGLDEALRIHEQSGGAIADELHPPHTSKSVLKLLGSGPTVLRGAVKEWGPLRNWDAEHLKSEAGDQEVVVMVVSMDGHFEVLPDRMERPPRSVMRLKDFIRLLEAKVDANLTIYARESELWPMGTLLAELGDPPLPWMERLKLDHVNFWLGDGRFRNTLHFDGFDNFLCQLSGSKHVLLYPPDAKPNLYYGNRRDIQAHYRPLRGEYGRHDTGIVSENTAEINGANPDLTTYPKFVHAREVQSYAALSPSDCLYLPNGWHHHVFSEADTDAGYNLAINLWIDRDSTLSGIPPRPDYKKEKYPTIRQVGRAIREVEPQQAAPDASQGECTVSDG